MSSQFKSSQYWTSWLIRDIFFFNLNFYLFSIKKTQVLNNIYCHLQSSFIVIHRIYVLNFNNGAFYFISLLRNNYNYSGTNKKEKDNCSTNNFLSPIPVSDWLIFCCKSSILHQKGRKDKNAKFLTKGNKKMPKRYM